MPYRWILPVLQLVLCAMALWPYHQHLLENASVLLGGAGDTTVGLAPPAETKEPANATPLDLAALTDPTNVDRLRVKVPLAIDLPALLAQTPYVFLSPTQAVWTPPGMTPQEWNAMFLPFAGLIFWWSAGRGIEAFLSSLKLCVYPRITWIETILATGMFMACTAFIGAIAFSPVPEQNQMIAGATGCALWSALSVPLIVAKVRQVRLEKIRIPDDRVLVTP